MPAAHPVVPGSTAGRAALPRGHQQASVAAEHVLARSAHREEQHRREAAQHQPRARRQRLHAPSSRGVAVTEAKVAPGVQDCSRLEAAGSPDRLMEASDAAVCVVLPHHGMAPVLPLAHGLLRLGLSRVPSAAVGRRVILEVVGNKCLLLFRTAPPGGAWVSITPPVLLATR